MDKEQKNYINQKITNGTNFRVLMYNKGYLNKPEYINTLIDIINKYISTMDVSYSTSDFTITVKIKKTAMKKYPNFSHNVMYYYGIFNTIFREFVDGLELYYDNSIPPIDSGEISGLYNLTCVSDNIIIVHL